MTDHPITPPPELRQLWAQQAQRMDPYDPVAWMQHVSAQAANWGADQELEACCEWAAEQDGDFDLELRAARRPSPTSLKEQALEALQSMQIDPVVINGVNINADVIAKYDTIRRALELLDD